MKTPASTSEPTIVRQVFEAWSVEIPAAFAETFVEEDAYWHGFDENRSVSMTSVVVFDEHGPVSAIRLELQLRPDRDDLLHGHMVEDVPPRLRGWAAIGAAPRSAATSRTLSGMLFVDGRALVTTITGGSPEWARSTWLSIRHHRLSASWPD